MRTTATRLIVMAGLMALGTFCLWMGIEAAAHATEARFEPILLAAGFLPGASFLLAGVLIATAAGKGAR